MECDYTHLKSQFISVKKKVATKGMIINGVHCRTFLGLALKCMIIILFSKSILAMIFFVKNSANYYLIF